MKKSEKKEPEEEILINRMYSGYDLDGRLGHEAINLFVDDKNRHYIYVLANGDYAYNRFKKIKNILIVRAINDNKLKVLAKATVKKYIFEENVKESWLGKKYTVIPGNKENKDKNLEARIELNNIQCNYIAGKCKDNNEPIKYNGKLLNSIFKDNKNNETSIYITFETENYRKAAVPIYIIKADKNEYILNKNETEKPIYYVGLNRKSLASQSLSNFIAKKKENQNFENLQELISNDNLWLDEEESKIKIKKENIGNKAINPYFLKLIKKENDEIIYSNMFQYFLSKNTKLCELFLNYIININNQDKNVKIGKTFKILREKENIDLLIEDKDENNIFVIENKIKSGINGIKVDKIKGKITETQLTNYYEKVKKEYENNRRFFFIFSPEYNNIEAFLKSEALNDNIKNIILENYCLITYEQLYSFFNKEIKEEDYFSDKDLIYFREFKSALEFQSVSIDERNFELMMQKFTDATNSKIEN